MSDEDHAAHAVPMKPRASRRAALLTPVALAATPAAAAPSPLMALAAAHFAAEEDYASLWDREFPGMDEGEVEALRGAAGERAHELAKELAQMEATTLAEAAAFARAAYAAWPRRIDGTPLLTCASEELAFRALDGLLALGGRPVPR